MSAPRRSRRAAAPAEKDTRNLLIESTIELMLEEGYAAATTRRVAAHAGVNPALVHYYFPTMDELFLAVFRRGAEIDLVRQRKALASESPVRALWEMNAEPRGTALLAEFMSLARHRKEIRAEIVAYAERFREGQLAALEIILRGHHIDTESLSPELVSLLLASASRILISEQNLGITSGHEQLNGFIEWFLRQFDKAEPNMQVALPYRARPRK